VWHPASTSHQPGIAGLTSAQVRCAERAQFRLFWGRRSYVKKPGTITVEILPAIQPGLTARL